MLRLAELIRELAGSSHPRMFPARKMIQTSSGPTSALRAGCSGGCRRSRSRPDCARRSPGQRFTGERSSPAKGLQNGSQPQETVIARRPRRSRSRQCFGQEHLLLSVDPSAMGR